LPSLCPELVEGLKDRPDSIDSQTHQQIVERVMDCYRACKSDQPLAKDPYQPGGEWANYLAERRTTYEAMMAGDSSTAGRQLRNFWRNELSPIVKEYAKYEQILAGEEEYIERFLLNVSRNYETWNEIFRVDKDQLEVPVVGNPWGLMIDDQLVIPKATRFHALASQIGELLRDVHSPKVVEIGAGYGGQAYYLLRDYSDITYVDLDLPETLVIAAYYLLATHPELNITLYGESSAPIGQQIEDHDVVMLPNYALPQLSDQSVDLCVNSFSFSEMPVETLREYFEQITRCVKSYLLHNNMDRRGVFNRGFERIPASDYPIDSRCWKRLYKRFDLFHGHQGDYREFLYQRMASSGRQN
jgi:putative sugar O-methyltransferase